VGEDRSADIHVSVSNDGGASFGELRIVAPSPGYSDATNIAVDWRGVLPLAWAESAGGPFAPSRIRYTSSFDGARSFEAPREISAAGPAHPELILWMDKKIQFEKRKLLIYYASYNASWQHPAAPAPRGGSGARRIL
jgi:hypothetical protein